MKDNIVVYHANCADGIGAALAAYMRFKDNADYLPMQYEDTKLADELVCLVDKNIYFLDVTIDAIRLEALAANNNVHVIDHHQSAQELLNKPELKNIKLLCIQMENSGAILAWKYFHPDIDAPMLLQYIQDRDLWQWQLPHSREFSVGFKLADWSLPVLAEGLNEKRYIAEAIATGKAVMQYQIKMVESIAKNATKVGFYVAGGGYKQEVPFKVLSVNSPVLQSELGEYLLSKNPEIELVCIYWHTPKETVHSLRSKGLNCTEIARQFGGGGHQRAAGFVVPRG